MSANANTISNLSKNKYTIKAQSTTTISFMGASPNYYRITNGGNTPLYLGVSMMPTTDFFDMKIPSGTTKLYVDAYGHDEVYIFNPSTEDANIIVTSFNASFDSSVLALSDIGQDFSQIDFSGEVVVKGFTEALPTGNNLIGKVEVSRLPENIDTRLNSIASHLRKITEAEDTQYITLYDVVQAIQNLNIDNSDVVDAINNKDFTATITGDIAATVDNSDVVEAINNKNMYAVYAKNMTVSASSIFTSYCEDNRVVSSVDFISNDGEHDIVLGICNILDNPDEYWTTITVKPNEVINNLTTYASAIKMTCDNSTGSKVRLVFREGVK